MKIANIYQSLLGLYGDVGNARVLEQRLAWRGMDVEVVEVAPGEPIPTDASLYLLGGGEDQAQITALQLLREQGVLSQRIDDGAVLFAICAGYQICGTSFTVGADDRVVEGLGLLNVDTRRAPERAVGEIVTRWERLNGTVSMITGFENHGGYTTLAAGTRPLATVVTGVGNCQDGTEGAVNETGRVLGTYQHGPCLARNPELADHLLELALNKRLPPLQRPAIDALRAERLRLAGA
ncbi:MAG: type 1 glutamine amidotransferase [Propionibacteriaceae bacterium]